MIFDLRSKKSKNRIFAFGAVHPRMDIKVLSVLKVTIVLICPQPSLWVKRFTPTSNV